MQDDIINFIICAGFDPDKRGMIRIKNDSGVGKYIFESQKLGLKAGSQADVMIICKRGVVPCHRPILMHFSPFLNELISENIRDVRDYY
jgi:hypothetical protein